ncbi:DNA methyltransferase [Catellatospora sp. TT07R-123]|uniref:DNA adenine methylase n=1 Tax=Catellatospora sp. TT07R-123 TaxID=2733863 RepID=UPI001B110845|nr:DNA adenine methylase [Catellatospora sp. TT07R-123]GHJ49056.1 DNA methyltransferase [Catellatospora sp. TT07R-123]
MLDKPGDLADWELLPHSVVSPLRYPGAKRQLGPVIAEVVKANVPPPRLLLEPFCGGASTALRLVGAGVAEHAILADADPLVAAFWHTAAFDTQWLISAMSEEREKATVAHWDWWRAAQPRGRRDRALKCLFLNRTTFSGILHGRAGPIGGRAQTSPYKIDCRFGLEGLTRRLNHVGALARTGRILDVWRLDWSDSIRRLLREHGSLLSSEEMLVYFDPPYVDKAEFLYEWSFDTGGHQQFARALQTESRFRWFLSYDDSPLVRGLYPTGQGRSVLHVSQQYTAAGARSGESAKARRASRDELLVTNYPTVPESSSYRVLGP